MRFVTAIAAVLACSVSLADGPRTFDMNGLPDKAGKTIAEWSKVALSGPSVGDQGRAIPALRFVAERGKPTPEEKQELAATARALLKTARDVDLLDTFHLCRFLRDPNLVTDVAPHLKTENAGWALNILEGTPGDKARAELLKCVQDSTFKERTHAIFSFSRLAGEEEFKALEKLHTQEKDPAIKESMAKALAVIAKRLGK